MAIHKGDLVTVTDEQVRVYFGIPENQMLLVIKNPYESQNSKKVHRAGKEITYTSLVKAIDLIFNEDILKCIPVRAVRRAGDQ